MVFTSAVRGGWSRRAVLGALGGAGGMTVLTGCGVFDRDPDPPDPLQPLFDSTRALAAGYETALTAHPELTDRLGPLHEAHLAHEAALREAIGRPELATPTASAGVWSPPIDDGATAEEAVTGLREAEHAGGQEARQACLSAPPARVALLGSIAAARVTHLEVLT